MPIGILVWLVLIIIIATLSNPYSWIIDLTLIGIAVLVITALWLLARFTDKRTRENQKESEKMYREWVEFYKKKHPGWKPRNEREWR